MPALQQGGGQSTGHRCCCPGEGKAGAGAVSLVLFPSLCVSGSAGAWRNIYGGGQSTRKHLIHYQRAHMEAQDSLCPRHSSVPELHT